MKRKMMFIICIISLFIMNILVCPINVYAASTTEATTTASEDIVVTNETLSCPLGYDVTKDLSGLLKIIRIVGTLALLAFSIFDVVKMLASGMSPTSGKETPPPKIVFGKFGKRMLGVVALFMIPTLIDYTMQTIGVWNEDGGCNLSLPVGNGQSYVPYYSTTNAYVWHTVEKKSSTRSTSRRVTTTASASSNGGGSTGGASDGIPNTDADYYYDNMKSPDSKSDYTIKLSADPNYVSRSVTLSATEKKWVISTIEYEQGACQAEAIATAQVIRDMYLYLGEFDSKFNTIEGIIDYAFYSKYKTETKSSAISEYAYKYVFEEGNSFYPRKMFGQRGFDLHSSEKNTLKYEVIFTMKSHYDGNGTKKYITDPTYATTYVIGNSTLEKSSYINPNYKGK